MIEMKSNLWNVVTVTNYLEQFVAHSNISQDNAMDNNGAVSHEHLKMMLGYFSLISLCRMNCLLGDFHSALEAVSQLNMFSSGKKQPFARVMSCYVSLYYHVGFAYLMMRRYLDAIKCFTTMLVFVLRNKQMHSVCVLIFHLNRKCRFPRRLKSVLLYWLLQLVCVHSVLKVLFTMC